MDSGPNTSKRSLFTILFADIKGYTAMMQQSEQKALAILKKYQDVLEELCSKHGGHVQKNYGDGSICLFESASECVKCAIALQQAFNTDPVVPVRIGLHEGDVVFSRNDVFGDSINVASRIESMGVPGNILLSKSLARKVKNQEDVMLTSLGDFHFKNVEEPIEVFAVSNDGLVVPDRKQLKGKFETSGSMLNTKNAIIAALIILILVFLLIRSCLPKDGSSFEVTEKSIAVMPFDNLSADKENEYFCKGIMQGIQSQLSMISDLTVLTWVAESDNQNTPLPPKVIGEQLNVQYVLYGSVEKTENKAMIRVTLTESQTSRIAWSEEYPCDWTTTEGLFDARTEITTMIAQVLQAQISPNVTQRIGAKPTNDPQAYESLLRGDDYISQYHYGRKTSEDNTDLLNRAKYSYEEAIRRDSLLAEAYFGLANVEWLMNHLDQTLYAENAETELQEFYQYVTKGLTINPDLVSGHLLLERYYRQLNYKLKSVEHLEIAYGLDPNNLEIIKMMCDKFLVNDLDIMNSYLMLKKLKERSKSSEELFEYYGACRWFYNKLGFDKEYRSCFRKMDSIDHENTYAATFYLEVGGPEYQLEKAIENHPVENLRGLNQIAYGYFQVGDMERYWEYRAKYEDLYQKEHGTLPEKDDSYGMALYSSGQKESGEELIRQRIDWRINKLETENLRNFDLMKHLFMYDSIHGRSSVEIPDSVAWSASVAVSNGNRTLRR